MRREFSAVQEHCLPKPIAIRYSPFAIRHSPSFRLGGSLALPFFSSLVPRPSSRSKSVLWFCVIDYGLKSAAWL
jgi:hypothetical protein